MDKITAPFTKEQVKALNEYQQKGFFHPFTCCAYEGCKRGQDVNEGILIAAEEGWICPCGKYKQNWAHAFMAEKHNFNKNYNNTFMIQETTKEQYEKELAERQRKHLENVTNQQNSNWRPCMHDQCPECCGTGVKHNGGICIHMISCSCSKCTPSY